MAFSSGRELLSQCRAQGVNISQIMLDAELERGKENLEQIRARIRHTLFVMRDSCLEPLEKDVECIGGMIGGEGKRLKARYDAGHSLLGGVVGRAVAYSMSVMETNSAMGRVIAAPTAGSSGVLPGVLLALWEALKLSEQTVTDGLLCAGAVGYLYMRNATVAGAEAGCQAEIGAASAMAAAAAVEMCGGTPEQAMDAAAISISNLLGLVCDPVAGLVQCPCQTRNATGVGNALICAEIALSGTKALIPFDEMLESMYRIGRDMPASLRETALGGCAATPSGRAWREKVFGGKK